MNKKCEELVTHGNKCIDNNELHNALYYLDKVAKWHPKCEVINQVHKVRMFALERLNQLDRAKSLSNKYKNINDVGLQRVRAIIMNRTGEQENSLNLALRLLDREDLDHKSNQELHFLVASIYDKKNEVDTSFKYFQKANDIIRKSPENSEYDKFYPLSFIDLMEENFEDINYITTCSNEEPVFLVGFPRSGTTLLKTILDSHSQIECVEEKPTLPVNHKFIVQDKENAINHFKNLTGKQIEDYQNFYWQEIAKFISGLDKVGNLIVDKFPLRFVDVGIINKIFPNAKYIFAVRHPLDCVLSCFMQNFEINDSMANFYTLDEAIHFYSKCMNLWEKYINSLNLNVYYIYYENLISNFEEEIKNLTSFLNLDMDENMFEYYKNASTSTPGYSQVIRKPYKDAMYRFERYEKYINTSNLEEYIKWWKY